MRNTLVAIILLIGTMPVAAADRAAAERWIKEEMADMPKKISPYGLNSYTVTSVELIDVAKTEDPQTVFYVIYHGENDTYWYTVSCMALMNGGWLCQAGDIVGAARYFR